MMGRGTARNMWSFLTKINLEKLVRLLVLLKIDSDIVYCILYIVYCIFQLTSPQISLERKKARELLLDVFSVKLRDRKRSLSGKNDQNAM